MANGKDVLDSDKHLKVLEESGINIFVKEIEPIKLSAFKGTKQVHLWI